MKKLYLRGLKTSSFDWRKIMIVMKKNVCVFLCICVNNNFFINIILFEKLFGKSMNNKNMWFKNYCWVPLFRKLLKSGHMISIEFFHFSVADSFNIVIIIFKLFIITLERPMLILIFFCQVRFDMIYPNRKGACIVWL